MTETWRPVASCGDIDDEDLIGVEVAGKAIAVYNLGGAFYATAGLCTHEDEPLADGMVIDGIIECPLHQGRFCVRTGKAKGAPASVDLKTYPVKVEDGRVFVRLPADGAG